MAQKRLKNRVVLITGASGGLGEQVAYQAAKAGATLILAARDLRRLLEVKEKCVVLSKGEVFVYQLDISDRGQVKDVIDDIGINLGRIDILVNNAGFGIFKSILDFDLDLVEQMFQVNVLGLIHITKTVVKLMVEQGGGQVINIASQGGKMATAKSTIYSATKAAVISFSNALRLELHSSNIRVTVVNPGPIKTNFFKKADITGKYLDSVGKIVLEPDYVAVKIVEAMDTKKREINLPIIMEVGSRLYCLFPVLGDFFARTLFNRK